MRNLKLGKIMRIAIVYLIALCYCCDGGNKKSRPEIWFHGIKIIRKNFIVDKNMKKPQVKVRVKKHGFSYWALSRTDTIQQRNETLNKMFEFGKALNVSLSNLIIINTHLKERPSLQRDRDFSERTNRVIPSIKAKSCYDLFYDKETKKAAKMVLYPTNRRNILLYCKTGYLLQINENGRISGTTNASSRYAILELQVISSTVKRIKSPATGRYLAINRRGKLVSKVNPSRDTYFEEEVLENYYHTFSSCTHPKPQKVLRWFIGIRRNGYPKKASRTGPGDPSIQFQYIFTE